MRCLAWSSVHLESTWGSSNARLMYPISSVGPMRGKPRPPVQTLIQWVAFISATTWRMTSQQESSGLVGGSASRRSICSWSSATVGGS